MKRFSDCARVRRFNDWRLSQGLSTRPRTRLPRMHCRRAASAEPAGLEAWKRIEAVVTHPRCANCHVDTRAIPIGRRPAKRKTVSMA